MLDYLKKATLAVKRFLTEHRRDYSLIFAVCGGVVWCAGRWLIWRFGFAGEASLAAAFVALCWILGARKEKA